MIDREDINRMAWKANLPSCHITHPKALERFAALVAAYEREKCAKVCEDSVEYAADELARQIRARREK
jgi:hypothetical protein